jgi:hypothetical protein
MIDKDTVTIFVEAQTKALKARGWFGTGLTDKHKATIRDSVEKAFEAVGVKVEGRDEKP